MVRGCLGLIESFDFFQRWLVRCLEELRLKAGTLPPIMMEMENGVLQDVCKTSPNGLPSTSVIMEGCAPEKRKECRPGSRGPIFKLEMNHLPNIAHFDAKQLNGGTN